jgi:hypothetical protein
MTARPPKALDAIADAPPELLAERNLPAYQVREDASSAMFVDCDHCDGSGVIASRVTVYEHGCGFPHNDTDERPCPECDGTGQREVEVEPITPGDINMISAKLLHDNGLLRAALEPFARAAEGITRNLRFRIADDHVIYRENGNDFVELRMGDFRRAREALE